MHVLTAYSKFAEQEMRFGVPPYIPAKNCPGAVFASNPSDLSLTSPASPINLSLAGRNGVYSNC